MTPASVRLTRAAVASCSVRLTRAAGARRKATPGPTPSDVDRPRVRRPSAPVRRPSGPVRRPSAPAGGEQASVPLGGQGRRKLEIKLVKNTKRRHTIFSKRKFGIMKKTHELAMLTGSQVLVVVVSDTGHVYTNATRGLQPLITGKKGQALIQSCLDSPDPPPHYDPSKDQRITSRGYQETDKAFQLPSEKPARGRRAQSTTSPMDNTTTTTSPMDITTTSSCCVQTQTTEQDLGMSSEPLETPVGWQHHTQHTTSLMDSTSEEMEEPMEEPFQLFSSGEMEEPFQLFSREVQEIHQLLRSEEMEETFQLLSEFIEGPQLTEPAAAPSTTTTTTATAMTPPIWNTELYPSSYTTLLGMHNGQWVSMDPQCYS